MHGKIGMQALREKIAAGTSNLLKADRPFFTNLGDRATSLRNSNGHVADFRRLRNEVSDWVRTFMDRPGASHAADHEVIDTACAWVELLDIEISNRALVSIGQGTQTAKRTGYVNAQTGEHVRVFDKSESIAADRGVHEDVSLGEVIACKLLGIGDDRIRNTVQEGTDSSGGYSVPTRILPWFIDRLRAKTQFIRAGARTLMLEGGATRILRIETDPVAAWRAESGPINISDPSFSVLEFHPKSLAVLVKASREVMADSVNIAGAIETAMIGAMSVALDTGCLFGDGTANNPVGLFHTSGISTISLGTNGLTPTNYDDLLNGLYQLEAANSDDPTAIIWHPRTALTYRKLKDTQGRYLQAPDDVRKIPMLATTSVPINQTEGSANNCSTILMGDFTDAILGLREQINITMLPQTFAATGEFAFIAHIRADVGFEHAAEFCAITGVLP